MSHLFYVLKIGIATAIVVLLMQIHIGETTIERHAEQFIRQSSILEPIRQISEGGFILMKNAYRKTMIVVDSFVTKQFRAENSPGQRKLVEIKRSLAFQKEQERKLEEQSNNSDYESEESEDLE